MNIHLKKIIIIFLFLSLVLTVMACKSEASEYIRGTVKSINPTACKIIIQDDKGFTKNIFFAEDTDCYDCSKNYDASSKTSINELTTGSTVILTVNKTQEGNYNTTGIYYLPPGTSMHSTWQEAWYGGSTSANQTDYQSNQSENYQTPSAGDLLQAQGIVTGINKSSGDITLQTLEGMQVSGRAHSQTMYYDMSTGFNLESTGNLSRINQGDIIGISYQPGSTGNIIEIIMFLPEGQTIDQTWMDLYNQSQGNY